MKHLIKKIKRLIKSILPDVVVKTKFSKFRNKGVKEVFTEIYNQNCWGSSESISGVGSERINTKSLIKSLDKLFLDLDIKSILDIPCGDFNWMQQVNLRNKNYIGADIVAQIIVENKKKYQQENIKFEVLDLTCSSLPQSDIVITRDCLVHLSYNDIYNSIRNIKSSKSKYLLTTSYPKNNINYDIVTGEWRKLNLQIKPFNFSKPMLIIDENYPGTRNEDKNKSMILWEISKIKLPTCASNQEQNSTANLTKTDLRRKKRFI